MWDFAAAGVLKVMLRDIEMKRERERERAKEEWRERENGKNVVWNDVTGMRLFDLYEPLKLDGAVNYIVSVMHTHTHTHNGQNSGLAFHIPIDSTAVYSLGWLSTPCVILSFPYCLRLSSGTSCYTLITML